MTKPSEFDVAVVGGGPAGLAAAIGFARQGLATIVLEKKLWPVDKTCGEGIMPTGVQELDRLGVLHLLYPQGTYFSGIEMISMHQRRAKADFFEGKGIGVRRTALSMALYERAQLESTLTLSANTNVRNIQTDNAHIEVRSDQGMLRCRFLVAADGLRSLIRSKLNAQLPSTSIRRYGANQHYQVKPWNHNVEVHFSNGMEAYVTPCGNDRIGVAFLWHYDRFSPQFGRCHLIENCLERFPDLRKRLPANQKHGPAQTTGPLRQSVSNTVHDKVALLGDAGGYFDAITGEGISLALIEARLLVEGAVPLLRMGKTITSDSLSAFVAIQKQLRRTVHFTTQLSLWTARHPWVQGPVFSLLGRQPALFQHFLSLNMGSANLKRLSATSLR